MFKSNVPWTLNRFISEKYLIDFKGEITQLKETIIALRILQSEVSMIAFQKPVFQGDDWSYL